MKRLRIISDPGYPGLKQHVIENTGLSYYADKDQDLAGRIARRLEARGVQDCTSYRRILDEQEMDALIGELTIGETYFYRQPEHFEALRRIVFPDLIERNRSSRRLRIWSAGCATGAEPYSVALLLRLELADMILGWDITILGTDINREFLARASEARFDNWAFRAGPKDLKTRCFQPEGKRWVLRPENKAWVSFQRHNLVKDPCPWQFDLILCRNVMIYFSPEVFGATVERLYDCLTEGGWLLVGHAELNAEAFKAFRTVSLSGVTLYQKSEPLPAAAVEPLPAASAPVRPPAAKPRKIRLRLKDRAGVTMEEVRSLADRGQWQHAASRCRRLIERDSLNGAAYFILGLILEHTGSAEEAELALRRAIYLDRSFVLPHYHLGLLLQRNRDLKQAGRAFENVIEILKRRPGEEALEHGDGITAGQLKELARMHLELLGKA